MTQIPPPPVAPPPPGAYGAPGVPAPAPKTSGMAIASLICGLLGFCTVGITGLVAIVLGVLGIRQRNVSGKPMAIIGLILGILSVGMWGLFGTGIFALVKGTQPQRDLARQFITDLSAGNIDAAHAATDGTISREEVEALSKTVQAWGPVTDTTFVGVSAEPGRTQVAGSVTFDKTPKGFEAVVVKQTDGTYKISGVHFK
jgi:hypothetical protein